jgi:hypothetical protein
MRKRDTGLVGRGLPSVRSDPDEPEAVLEGREEGPGFSLARQGVQTQVWHGAAYCIWKDQPCQTNQGS